MQQVVDKFNFSIILKSEDIEDSSEYWQGQCWQLYDSICRNLPDGWMEPVTLKGSEGEKTDLTTIFSTLGAFGIAGKVFADIFLDAMKTWLEYRPTAEIEVKFPDGSTVNISKLPIAKLSKFFEDNPQLSICEALNRFKNSNE